MSEGTVVTRGPRTGVARVAQIGAGVLLIIAGIAMLVLPGPGLVSIAAGLNFIWPGNRLVRWMRRKVPGLSETGAVPKTHIALGAALLITGTIIGVFYGQQMSDWARGLIS